MAEDHVEVPLEEPDVNNLLEFQNKPPVTTNKELWGKFIQIYIYLVPIYIDL
jgi:hypothetical protein